MITNHQVARIEFATARTEELAWKHLRLSLHARRNARGAGARAERDGFTGDILPNKYFVRSIIPSPMR